jgi:hypothetical protein
MGQCLFRSIVRNLLLILVLQQVTTSATTFLLFSVDITEVVTTSTVMKLLWLNDGFDCYSVNIMVSG